MACTTRKHIYFILLNKCNSFKFLLSSGIVNNGRNNLMISAADYCSNAAAPAESTKPENVPSQRISRAMESYLKRSREYETFIKEETEAYNKGKNFLAKIMNENPETFDQQKVDEAIEYLFPSSLYDKKARPCFKSPEILFPKQKEAQFDHTGRPFHFLFYTCKPNFYEVLHKCAEYLERLNKKVMKLGPDALPPKKSIALVGTVWLKKKELEEKLLENLTNNEYETFIESMDLLLQHPYAYEAADFILKYRLSEMSRKVEMKFPPKTELENGQSLVTVEGCRKKRCYATVKVLSPGTGKLLINGKQMIDFFADVRNREQVSTLN